MKNLLTVATMILSMFALSGCDRAVFDNLERRVVRQTLKDPDSAKWGNEVVVKNYACLAVNAKNSFGGYTGDQTAWLKNAGSNGAEEWFLEDMNSSPCYERALQVRVDRDTSLAAFEAKLATTLNEKGLFKVTGSALPPSNPSDSNANKCVKFAHKVSSSYRRALDTAETPEYEANAKSAESALVALQAGRCE